VLGLFTQGAKPVYIVPEGAAAVSHKQHSEPNLDMCLRPKTLRDWGLAQKSPSRNAAPRLLWPFISKGRKL
jgi:hypothetical protein